MTPSTIKPSNLQLLIILSVALCMAAGSFAAPIQHSSLASPARVASR